MIKPEELMDTEQTKSYLYVIRRYSDGYYKIGITTDPMERFDQIERQTGSPIITELLFEYPNQKAAREEERKLHKQYDDCRCLGEWFNFRLKKSPDAQSGRLFMLGMLVSDIKICSDWKAIIGILELAWPEEYCCPREATQEAIESLASIDYFLTCKGLHTLQTKSRFNAIAKKYREDGYLFNWSIAA